MAAPKIRKEFEQVRRDQAIQDEEILDGWCSERVQESLLCCQIRWCRQGRHRHAPREGRLPLKKSPREGEVKLVTRGLFMPCQGPRSVVVPVPVTPLESQPIRSWAPYSSQYVREPSEGVL